MLTPVSVAVLVSGGGTNLQAILDAQGTAIRSARVALVVSSNEKAYALQRARVHGIETLIFSDEATLQAELEQRKIEMIVLAGFLKILSGEFTQRWPRRILNVHPSLIPAFCGRGMYGLRVHEAALARGVKITGATVHYVNEIPDGGQIIAQKAVPVEPDDTPQSLQKRVMEQAEWVLLPQAVEQAAKEIEHERFA